MLTFLPQLCYRQSGILYCKYKWITKDEKKSGMNFPLLLLFPSWELLMLAHDIAKIVKW